MLLAAGKRAHLLFQGYYGGFQFRKHGLGLFVRSSLLQKSPARIFGTGKKIVQMNLALRDTSKKDNGWLDIRAMVNGKNELEAQLHPIVTYRSLFIDFPSFVVGTRESAPAKPVINYLDSFR